MPPNAPVNSTLNRMTPCPHCHGFGVSDMAKRRSSREGPAKCTLCKRLSHVIASDRSGIPGFTLTIVVGVAVLGAIGGQLLLGGLVGIVPAVLYNQGAWKRVELFPISGESAVSSRRASWVVNLLAVLSIFLQ